MTNPKLVKAAQDHYSEQNHEFTNSSLGPLYPGRCVLDAFIAGAEWQKGQPITFIGWDLAAPGADYTAETVVMTKAEFDKMKKDAEHWSNESARLYRELKALKRDHGSAVISTDHWRQEVGKLNSKINGLNDVAAHRHAQITARDEKIAAQNDCLCQAYSDRDKAISERDDWHGAYDRLVSDVVHGRHKPAEPSTAREQAMQDAATFGMGMVHVASNGEERCIHPRDLYKYADKPKAEPTGGFTANGDNGKAEPGCVDVDELIEGYEARIDRLERRVHLYKLIARARQTMNNELAEHLSEALDLLER